MPSHWTQASAYEFGGETSVQSTAQISSGFTYTKRNPLERQAVFPFQRDPKLYHTPPSTREPLPAPQTVAEGKPLASQIGTQPSSAWEFQKMDWAWPQKFAPSSSFPSSHQPTCGNQRSDLFFYEFVCFWTIGLAKLMDKSEQTFWSTQYSWPTTLCYTTQ